MFLKKFTVIITYLIHMQKDTKEPNTKENCAMIINSSVDDF